MLHKQTMNIGRFGPLCLNHIDLFKQTTAFGKRRLIGIGVPDYERAAEVLNIDKLVEYKLRNLYPYELTSKIIKQYVDCTTAPIPDIFSEEDYADHVYEQFDKVGVTIDDCVLVGENEWTNRCFEGRMETVTAKHNTGFHATDVRRELYLDGSSKRVANGYSALNIKQAALAQQVLDSNGDGKVRNMAKYNFLFGGN